MSNPILAMIPSGYNAADAKLYSILPSDGSGDFTVSVDADATRVNKEGLIEGVALNQARLTYNPLNTECPSLLLEPTVTNLQVYSQQFDNALWTKSRATITANSEISPSGQLTADKLTGDGTGTSYVFDGITLTNGVSYTISIFVKPIVNISSFAINVFGGIGIAYFDLVNKNTGSFSGDFNSSRIEDYGNGWLRCSATLTLSSSSGVKNIGYGLISYNGDLFYLFGSQVEQGNYVTSYVPTVNTQVTRTNDFIDNAGSGNLFNSLESTFFVEMASFLNTQTNSNGIELSDSSGQNRITLQYDTVNNQIRCDVRVLNVAQATITTQSFDVTNFNKMAITYKLNEVKFYVNGQLIGTDTSVNLFSPNTLTEVRSTIAGISSSEFNLQAKIKDLRVYNKVLTEAEAIKLTI